MKNELLVFLVSSSEKLPYLSVDLHDLAIVGGATDEEWNSVLAAIRHGQSFARVVKSNTDGQPVRSR